MPDNALPGTQTIDSPPRVVRTPGRPDTIVVPRDGGGVCISQGRNRIWLGDTERRQLAAILEGTA